LGPDIRKSKHFAVKVNTLTYNINFEIIMMMEVYYASNSFQLGFLTCNFHHDGANIHTGLKHS